MDEQQGRKDEAQSTAAHRSQVLPLSIDNKIMAILFNHLSMTQINFPTLTAVIGIKFFHSYQFLLMALSVTSITNCPQNM